MATGQCGGTSQSVCSPLVVSEPVAALVFWQPRFNYCTFGRPQCYTTDRAQMYPLLNQQLCGQDVTICANLWRRGLIHTQQKPPLCY